MIHFEIQTVESSRQRWSASTLGGVHLHFTRESNPLQIKTLRVSKCQSEIYIESRWFQCALQMSVRVQRPTVHVCVYSKYIYTTSIHTWRGNYARVRASTSFRRPCPSPFGAIYILAIVSAARHVRKRSRARASVFGTCPLACGCVDAKMVAVCDAPMWWDVCPLHARFALTLKSFFREGEERHRRWIMVYGTWVNRSRTRSCANNRILDWNTHRRDERRWLISSSVSNMRSGCD